VITLRVSTLDDIALHHESLSAEPPCCQVPTSVGGPGHPPPLALACVSLIFGHVVSVLNVPGELSASSNPASDVELGRKPGSRLCPHHQLQSRPILVSPPLPSANFSRSSREFLGMVRRDWQFEMDAGRRSRSGSHHPRLRLPFTSLADPPTSPLVKLARNDAQERHIHLTRGGAPHFDSLAPLSCQLQFTDSSFRAYTMSALLTSNAMR